METACLTKIIILLKVILSDLYTYVATIYVEISVAFVPYDCNVEYNRDLR